MKSILMLLPLAGVLLASSVHAREDSGYSGLQIPSIPPCDCAPTVASEPLPSTVPTSTSQWLSMQSQGVYMTSYSDKLTPQAAAAAKERMEKSFSHPIPDKFIKDKLGED